MGNEAERMDALSAAEYAEGLRNMMAQRAAAGMETLDSRREAKYMETQAENERLREDYDAIELAWTNTDAHPRHAPESCAYCDTIYAIVTRRALGEEVEG